MKRKKTEREIELIAEWDRTQPEWARHEADRLYATARLCSPSLTHPDTVSSLETMLRVCLLGQAEIAITRHRIQNELQDLQPERIITEVASLDQIADATVDKIRGRDEPETPIGPTSEPLAKEVAELREMFSDERRAERLALRLKMFSQDLRIAALVKTGLFVQEADGRLKPVEPAEPPVP